MSTKFYTLLTEIGAAKLANATALGVPVKITQMAVGDGGGSLPTPSAQQTKLVGEKRRAALNQLYIDPQNTSQIIAEQVIPENEGGWWIREVGLFDESGALIAVGNCAESYKPLLTEGSGRTQTVRMILITRSTENITLKIDPSVVLATRNYVDTKAIALETGINDQLRDKQPLDETLSDLSGKAPQDILKYLGLLGDGELSSIGRFVGVKVFTSSGKYVPDKSVRFVVVEGVGGGAGGGGSCSPLEGKMSAAAGGMGGSYGKMITKVDGDVMVYIGYGGTGGQGSKNQEGAKKGTAGGDTQFGTWLICPGGSEGKASNSFTPPSICQSSNRTGKECTGANIYQINGDAAGQGLAINGGGLSGRGADSVFGRGGNSVSSMTSSPGEKGYGFGSGGSGALSNSNSPGEKGGDGSPGLIIIWEYA